MGYASSTIPWQPEGSQVTLSFQNLPILSSRIGRRHERRRRDKMVDRGASGVSQHNRSEYILTNENNPTVSVSRWLMSFKMFVISVAASVQRVWLCSIKVAGRSFFSALKMAAWCRVIVDVWIAMLMKIALQSLIADGSRKWGGRDKDFWSRILSRLRCLFQYSPWRSSSRSSGPGRCRWCKFLPKKWAMKTTPANELMDIAPWGVMHAMRDWVDWGVLFWYASSLAGKLVMT